MKERTVIICPLTDHRVKALAVKEWGERSYKALAQFNTHYSPDYGFFCKEGDKLWDATHKPMSYAEYLESRNTKKGD